MTRRSGPRTLPVARVAAVVALGLLLVGCSAVRAALKPSSSSAGPDPVASSPPTPTATPSPTPKRTTLALPTSEVTPTPAARTGTRLPAAARRAGLRTRKVAWSAGGKLRVVPGKSAAPGKGRIYRVRIEVEAGLNVDRAAFAGYVLATLNDKRSWTENGRRRFARTDRAYDLRVVLASPATSAAMCRPLRTFGKLSCRRGDMAVLTLYRWTKAMPEYAGNHDGYRHYMVNHEVGHVLGNGHELCPGRGRMAPVMMQQTKGLNGCKPNPWPHP